MVSTVAVHGHERPPYRLRHGPPSLRQEGRDTADMAKKRDWNPTAGLGLWDGNLACSGVIEYLCTGN